MALVPFLLMASVGVGCRQRAARSGRTLIARGAESEVYIRSISGTLNDLAGNVDLELLPAQPILTAATSANGKEVRAICTVNPKVPDGPIDYMVAVDGNANFASLEVQPGDIVRYYVNVDAESAARGLEQRTALELRVRRLDTSDPQNALIIEGGLSNPALAPQRIEIWRYSDKRQEAIRSALHSYETLRNPPLGWEPTADLAALRQVVERANQWFRNQPAADAKWQPPAQLAELPEALRKSKGVVEAISDANLRDGTFDDWEGRFLEQAVWCRDIAQWARGHAVTDPDVAAALFDWTVRNIELDGEGAPTTILFPWQALAYGHGTALDRAWVFVELCRQQRIDAVILRPKAPEGKSAPLWVGAIIEKQLYLFDPRLGLLIPGKESPVATLEEVVADPWLVHQLDVEGKFTYPLPEGAENELEAFVVASPIQLARRSQLLERSLEGEDFVKLAVDVPSTVERLAAFPQVKSVKLWQQPFEAIADAHGMKFTDRQQASAEFAPFGERPILWKARLMHFQGNKDVRAEERRDPLAEPRHGHQDALDLYQHRTVRPPEAELAKLDPLKRTVYAAAKAEASYWLGLLSYDRGNFKVAADWLGPRTLERDPKGKWVDGARYNLARTYEADGQTEKAIDLLEKTPTGDPQRDGNLVRAQRLKSAASKTDQPSSTPSGARPSP